MAECFFKTKYGKDCEAQKDKCSQNKGPARIQSIVDASKVYGDGLGLPLKRQFQADQNFTISFHKNCVSRYTSKTNLSHRRSTLEDAGNDKPAKKRLRHSEELFDFKTNCLYCGEACDVDKNVKNPSRWRPSYMVRSTHSEHESQPYTEFILSKCKERADEWSEEVQLRLQGALSDLHAAEARYHVDCRNRFFLQ